MLLRKGANVCALSKGCQTALHFAAEMGHVDVAAALLDEAAQELIVMKDEGNWTALHHAAEQGSLEIVELLLQVGNFTLLPIMPLNDNGCSILSSAIIVLLSLDKTGLFSNLGSSGLGCVHSTPLPARLCVHKICADRPEICLTWHTHLPAAAIDHGSHSPNAMTAPDVCDATGWG